MTKKIIFMGLSALAITLAGCSWTDRQIGPNDYEISGYFDFTMKGEVVVKVRSFVYTESRTMEVSPIARRM